LDLSSNWHLSDLPSDIDVIVHLAQARRYREFPQRAAETIDVNLTSTAKLLDFAASSGVRTFIYASTGGVYRTSHTLLTEASPLRRPDECELYPATKLASEQLIGAYRSVMSTSILRLFTVFGEGSDPESLIPRLERSIAAGSPVTLQGPDGVLLRPTHASDVVRAITVSLEGSEHRLVNVAGPELMTLRELADRLGKRTGRSPAFQVSDGPAAVLAPDITHQTEIGAAPVIVLPT
jgi:nucleoside-diphosphate-sugar epimerase